MAASDNIIIIDDEGVWWNVESIKGFKVKQEEDSRIVLKFSVKWSGFPECTWEPYESLDQNTTKLAKEFICSHLIRSSFLT